VRVGESEISMSTEDMKRRVVIERVVLGISFGGLQRLGVSTVNRAKDQTRGLRELRINNVCRHLAFSGLIYEHTRKFIKLWRSL